MNSTFASTKASQPQQHGIRALTFDVFGTVVDWRSAIIHELQDVARSRNLSGDWEAFTDEWKSTYRPAMDRINAGRSEWENVDAIYRRRLEELLPRYGLDDLDEAERYHLNRVWCRPIAWPDSVSGISRMKSRYVVSTLSNGNFAWLVDIAKFCALPFDCIITAENARAYKPDPRVYRAGRELLGLRPEQVLMVACHNYDLAAAREEGLKTAFLPRREFGPDQATDQSPEGDWDFVARDLRDLAAQLGC